MPKASPSYTSFGSGELSPLIFGRSDIDQYYKGGSKCRNMMVTQYGPCVRRPGTQYVGETIDHTKVTRLISFKANRVDDVAIEISHLKFRFYDSNGIMKSGGVPIVVAHPYTESELFELDYDQSHDVVTICHRNHRPAKLTRTGTLTWILSEYAFVGAPYRIENTDVSKKMTVSPKVVGASTMTATGHTPFTADMVGTIWKVGLPHGSPEEQGYVKVDGYTSATVVSVHVFSEISVDTATDRWAEAAWSDAAGVGWPSKCVYFQSHLAVANNDLHPNGVWISQPFLYDNFSPGTGLPDEAINEVISDANIITWLFSGRTLIIGSDRGDFAISASDSRGSITPENLSIAKQTNWSSDHLRPQFIGSKGYYVQSGGRKLREMFYSFQEDTYQSVDMTAVSEHITDSGIKDIVYQRDPYSILWCVLNNGKIALMTRESDQESLGWSLIETDGFYESVTAIPHPTEYYDIIFAVVRRKVGGVYKRYVERFTSPIIPDRQDSCYYVDCGVVINQYNATDGNTLTLSSMSGTVVATSSSPAFIASDVGRRIRSVDSEGKTIGQMTITGFTSTTVVEGETVKDFDSLTSAPKAWAVSTHTVSGLSQIEGKEVVLLVDGGTAQGTTVSGGVATLSPTEDGFVISCGLSYTSIWRNMPIESGSATGTAQGKKKRIYQCGFKFYRSLGMQAGSSETTLHPLQQRSMSTPMGEAEPLFTGVIPPVKLNTTFDYEGHIVVEQSQPLPMCLLAVMPLLETNDK